MKRVNRMNKKKFNINAKAVMFISLLALMFTLALNSTAIFAANTLKPQRTESVYIGLDNYGEATKGTMYVDTMLNGLKEIKDNGKFKSVENMTNKIKPIYDENENLIWDLTTYNGESFAYNTELNEDTFINIPWKFDITYELNGKPADPNKLAHEAGLVKIIVHAIPNKEADKFFKNNYMMEITSDFDLNDFISVTSDDALETITGKTKTLMFVVLPGQDKTIEIMLGTEDFKYDGLTFAMVPLSGEISDKVMDLIRDKKDLEDAYNSSMEGTSIVLDALGNMTGSLNKAASGLKSLRTGTIKMHDLKGSRDITVEELDKEIDDLEDSLDDILKDMTEYRKYLSNAEKDIEDFIDEVDDLEKITRDIPDLTKDSRKLLSDSRKVVQLLSKNDPSDVEKDLSTYATKVGKELQLIQAVSSAAPEEQAATMAYYMANSDYNLLTDTNVLTAAPEFIGVLGNLVSSIQDLSTLKESCYDNISIDLKNINTDLKSLEDNGDVFSEVIDSTEELLDDVNDTLKYINKKDGGFDHIEEIIDSLDSVLNTCNNAIPNIKTALNILSTDLYNGAINTLDGLTDATNNLTDVTKQTASFMTAKDKLDKVIRTNWEDIDNNTTLFEMDVNAEVVSFSSSENKNTSKVQIFLKSPEIKEVIDDDDYILSEAQVKSGFWNRVWSLFVKLWEAIVGIFK